MILIGTMNLTRTRERGNFYCPTCAVDQPYRLRARRPWLTLYFIPVVPVGGAELFIQCEQCRKSWDTSVLHLREEQHSEVDDEMFGLQAVRAAVLVVIADGTITDNEIKALRRISRQILGREVDREELGEMCSIARQNEIAATDYVMTVSRNWSGTQRIVALQAMFLAASADGEMGELQISALAEMRDLLELSESEYEGAIESALSWED